MLRVLLASVPLCRHNPCFPLTQQRNIFDKKKIQEAEVEKIRKGLKLIKETERLLKHIRRPPLEQVQDYEISLIKKLEIARESLQQRILFLQNYEREEAEKLSEKKNKEDLELIFGPQPEENEFNLHDVANQAIRRKIFQHPSQRLSLESKQDFLDMNEENSRPSRPTKDHADPRYWSILADSQDPNLEETEGQQTDDLDSHEKLKQLAAKRLITKSQLDKLGEVLASKSYTDFDALNYLQEQMKPEDPFNRDRFRVHAQAQLPVNPFRLEESEEDPYLVSEAIRVNEERRLHFPDPMEQINGENQDLDEADENNDDLSDEDPIDSDKESFPGASDAFDASEAPEASEASGASDASDDPDASDDSDDPDASGISPSGQALHDRMHNPTLKSAISISNTAHLFLDQDTKDNQFADENKDGNKNKGGNKNKDGNEDKKTAQKPVVEKYKSLKSMRGLPFQDDEQDDLGDDNGDDDEDDEELPQAQEEEEENELGKYDKYADSDEDAEDIEDTEDEEDEDDEENEVEEVEEDEEKPEEAKAFEKPDPDDSLEVEDSEDGNAKGEFLRFVHPDATDENGLPLWSNQQNIRIEDSYETRGKATCLFCSKRKLRPNQKKGMTYLHPLNIPLLRRFMFSNGLTMPRRLTGMCLKHQTHLKRCIRKAQHLGFFRNKKSLFTSFNPFEDFYDERGYLRNPKRLHHLSLLEQLRNCKVLRDEPFVEPIFKQLRKLEKDLAKEVKLFPLDYPVAYSQGWVSTHPDDDLVVFAEEEAQRKQLNKEQQHQHVYQDSSASYVVYPCARGNIEVREEDSKLADRTGKLSEAHQSVLKLLNSVPTYQEQMVGEIIDFTKVFDELVGTEPPLLSHKDDENEQDSEGEEYDDDYIQEENRDEYDDIGDDDEEVVENDPRHYLTKKTWKAFPLLESSKNFKIPKILVYQKSRVWQTPSARKTRELLTQKKANEEKVQEDRQNYSTQQGELEKLREEALAVKQKKRDEALAKNQKLLEERKREKEREKEERREKRRRGKPSAATK